jgi:hypothetical protein
MCHDQEEPGYFWDLIFKRLLFSSLDQGWAGRSCSVEDHSPPCRTGTTEGQTPSSFTMSRCGDGAASQVVPICSYSETCGKMIRCTFFTAGQCAYTRGSAISWVGTYCRSYVDRCCRKHRTVCQLCSHFPECNCFLSGFCRCCRKHRTVCQLCSHFPECNCFLSGFCSCLFFVHSSGTAAFATSRGILRVSRWLPQRGRMNHLNKTMRNNHACKVL